MNIIISGIALLLSLQFTLPAKCQDADIMQVGKAVNIASSAYKYRADQADSINDPESWFAIMLYAGLPLNKAVDLKAEDVTRALTALLWEEIRPLERLELRWDKNARNRPAPEDLEITTLERKGNASSWWNNLVPVKRIIIPVVSADSTIYSYAITADVSGLVVSHTHDKSKNFDIPSVGAFTKAQWKKMEIEVELGVVDSNRSCDYSGKATAYDGVITNLKTIDERSCVVTSPVEWKSTFQNKRSSRRGIHFTLLYTGISKPGKTVSYTTPASDVSRTIVTFWTKSGNFSFLASDLENGPVYAPEYGIYIRQLTHPPAEMFISNLKTNKTATVREKIRRHQEQTWKSAIEGIKHIHADTLSPHPMPPREYLSPMRVNVPSARLTAQWNLGAWHLLRHCKRDSLNGRLIFNDHPYGILAAETYLILASLDLIGLHKEAADGFNQWLKLPVQPLIKVSERVSDTIGQWVADKHMGGTLLDKPTGNFSDGYGAFTLAEGTPGTGGHMDGVHAYGPGCIGWAINQHYFLTRDNEWLKQNIKRIQANVEWMLRQRKLLQTLVPGGDRLWGKGLQPAHEATPDSGGLFMQWYWSESFYYATVMQFAALLSQIDSVTSLKFKKEAEAYREDIRLAAERSIALSPIMQTQDGTFHSVLPFACYMRGLGTGAWGWQRDGSGNHWGPLTFETDLSASPIVTVAEILSIEDKRVQGYLDVLEDILLINNPRTDTLTWMFTGWQHQVGIQKTIDAHLAGDDIPVFLRSFLNSYAVHIVPENGYVFNEHVFGGPPDKIFEEAAFLIRFRNLLLIEDKRDLWLARGTPREWFKQGKRIIVNNAPSHFGEVAYEITSDIDHGKINAKLTINSQTPPENILIRFRHPRLSPIKKVLVNGREWKDFNSTKEYIRLHHLTGKINVECLY